MLLKHCIVFSALFITINAITIQEQSLGLGLNECPTFQYKCPDCEEGTKCVYPNSNGCPNAGIPICQAIECPNTVCLIQRIPCPKECPFSCRYNGPPCCPFNGKPECEPVCNTFVPCHVTPCPEDCPDNCHYPNADYCCPKSRTPVCNLVPRSLHTNDIKKSLKKGGLGYKSMSNWGFEYSNEAKTWDAMPTHLDPVGWGYDRHGNFYTCDPDDHTCPFGNSANNKYGNKKQAHDHYHGDDDYFEGLFIGGNSHHQECSTCTKTVTDIDLQLEFITTTAVSGDIVCAQYIIPCPHECPYDCLYPMDQPCPFTQEPWCPSIFDRVHYKKNYKTLSITDGYQFPRFPTNDPFHSIFTSILNNSGVTATTSFIAPDATESPINACPLIFRYCPVECPNSCLRPDVPCPFAAEGYCPGSSPTKTVPESALITPTAETVVGGELICPLYMLACPMCPKGYSCARKLTGHCPNTNVPYCVSKLKATPTLHATPSASLIYYQPVPWGGIRVQQIVSDVCERAGLTKVKTKQIFDQLQERRSDCEGCPFLEWDEYCPNICIYRTEDSCCIQSMCLPN